jgi:hypothetical protein
VSLVLEEDVHQFERFLYAQGRGILFPVDVVMPSHDYGEEESELRRRFGTHVDSSLRRFVIGLQLDEDIEPGSRAHASPHAGCRVWSCPW